MAQFQYPLNFRFKLVALSPQVIVTDAAGHQVLYVHQKVFNIREDIRVYSDNSRTVELFRIKTEKIIDFNAKYQFTQASTGAYLGHVRPRGLRSIWNATYLVYDSNDEPKHHIREDNPWVKVLDSIIGQIEYIGWLTGFFLNPSYTVYQGDSRDDMTNPVFHLKKNPAFFEGSFTLSQAADVTPEEEARLLLATLLMISFMRRRG